MEFTYLNRRAINEIAWGRELLGKNLWETFPSTFGSVIGDSLSKASVERSVVIFQAYHPDLHAHYEVHVHPAEDGLAVFFRNVTDRLEEEKMVARLEERNRLATRSSQEGIWDWDIVAGDAYFSARWQEILGHPAVEHAGSISHWLDKFHPKDRVRAATDFERLKQNDETEFDFEYRVRHLRETWCWIRSRGTVVRDAKNNILRMAGSISDVTDRITTDPLTGTLNRAALVHEIEDEIACLRADARQSSLLVIDLDLFSRISDSYGQEYGSTFLQLIAARLGRAIALPAKLAA